MILSRFLILGIGFVVLACGPASAEQTDAATTPPPAASATSATEATAPAAVSEPVVTPATNPIAEPLRLKLAAMPSDLSEQERNDRTALTAFYEARNATALWVTSNDGLTPQARALITEIKNAGAYGLDAKAFKLPDTADGKNLSPDECADAEFNLSLAALTYARHARGGRIADPAAQLNSNLDRRPQWIDPKVVLDALASSQEPDAYLRSLHPKHPQFEKLRQLYVEALPKNGGPLSAAAKRLRTNMEMWRWMSGDMGAMHVLNNIPEFMQYVYKDGQIIRSERIVAGMIDKQSSIFSRPLKYVVLRPKWRVPESIKVNELWPSLLRGGGLMRQYGLELETKDGQLLDWRKIDWTKADIRSYEVTQATGPKSVLGHVKFSFPSQHTIYMHDTPDKWMFKSAQRTLSHGCLRVRNPMELAEIILKEDKGWDAAKIAELDRSGPSNNEIAIDKRIPIHLVYFTAWVGDDGRLKTFADVYGHEKRVTQALDGQWDKINKGRDHLAPVEPNFNPATVAARAPLQDRNLPPSARKEATIGDFIGSALGLGF